MQKKEGLVFWYLLFWRNVWSCATCQIGQIRTLNRPQFIAAAVMQWLFIINEPDETHALMLFATVASYALCLYWKRTLRTLREPSPLEPVFMGMVIVMPVASAMSAWISPVFLSLIVIYALVFRVFDAHYIADLKESGPDSLFAPSVLQSVPQISDEQVRQLRDGVPHVAVGEVIGHFKDEPIYSWVRTADGVYFDFERVIPSASAFETPKTDFVIMAPGIFYGRRREVSAV